MSSVKQQLEGWRRQLKRQAALNRRDIAELEDHLLEELDSLKKAGLNEQASFDRAVQKIGSMEDLSREYGKNRPFDALLGMLATSPWITGMLGLLLVTGGGFHVFYSLRFFWRVEGGLNLLTLAIFLVMLWSVIKGMMLLAGRQGGHVGLLLFFLVQVPVLYLGNGNYDIATGAAINLYFGDIDTRLVFDPGSELHINVGDVSSRQYVGINLLALFVCVLMMIRIWFTGRQKAC